MTTATTPQRDKLVDDALHAFDALNGPQPGFRPAHAKGILIEGQFTPAPSASALTRAPHVLRASTPVTVRFSDFAGIPTVPDNSPDASPRGMVVRFHLAEHVHTDIIAHSVNGFPARTAEEFVQFLRAIATSGPGAAKPTPVEQFLGTHPAALEFVQAPKPMPVSFTTETFYAVSAYKFINAEGVTQFGRYRLVPASGAAEFLAPAAEANAAPNYLFDELRTRLDQGRVKMRVQVQLAEAGDVVDDSTSHWPEDRAVVEFGTVELLHPAAANAAGQQHLIFDPIPRVDGIEPSGDPLLQARADIYLASGHRRRDAK
jgi:catalase